MASIKKNILKLKVEEVGKKVDKRLREFSKAGRQGNKRWFSEMCFCILTANSKARTALKIQEELDDCFDIASENKIRLCIIKNKHRFHNNKTRYILEARKNKNIKDLLKGKKSEEAREWIVKNIKGLGYKEASHFLRNVGFFDLAILDRHILALMNEEGLIKEVKTPSKRQYLDIEQKFSKFAKSLDMSPAELDLYMWYLKGGEVLK